MNINQIAFSDIEPDHELGTAIKGNYKESHINIIAFSRFGRTIFVVNLYSASENILQLIFHSQDYIPHLGHE